MANTGESFTGMKVGTFSDPAQWWNPQTLITLALTLLFNRFLQITPNQQGTTLLFAGLALLRLPRAGAPIVRIRKLLQLDRVPISPRANSPRTLGLDSPH